MSRNCFYYHFVTPSSRNDARAVLCRGMTLVEILIAVTLMTFIMLAAIRVLAYVSTEMKRAESAMLIASRARTTQLQIERDLGCITAPLTPPLRFDDAQGYFCIIEGLGSYYGNLRRPDGNIGWRVENIAGNDDTLPYTPDSTIGDCDDILMFTARASGDSMYRGLVGGQVRESKEAEICYFLRGTTLYRRVLLIIPDEQLQETLNDPSSGYSNGAYPARQGYGFYRDFDVSARLEWDDVAGEWRVKANTLADLTRRENRFGHAFRNLDMPVANALPFPYGIHNNAAWYQLRLPTLAECTMDDNAASWRLGTQIVTTANRYDRLVSALVYEGDGSSQVNIFPMATGTPYIDYWNNPLPWNQNNVFSTASQSLMVGSGIFANASTSTFQFPQRVSEDVLLNNVISFNIEVWHAENKEFIDLGGYKNDNTDFQLTAANSIRAREISKDLGSQGFFGRLYSATNGCYGDDGTYSYGLLPCVFDTWTDAYENDATSSIFGMSDTTPIQGIAVDPSFDGQGITDIMEHVDQWRCPPPYNVPLTGIQIKIRVFDPDTNNIREVTIRKNFQ